MQECFDFTAALEFPIAPFPEIDRAAMRDRTPVPVQSLPSFVLAHSFEEVLDGNIIVKFGGDHRTFPSDLIC